MLALLFSCDGLSTYFMTTTKNLTQCSHYNTNKQTKCLNKQKQRVYTEIDVALCELSNTVYIFALFLSAAGYLRQELLPSNRTTSVARVHGCRGGEE